MWKLIVAEYQVVLSYLEVSSNPTILDLQDLLQEVDSRQHRKLIVAKYQVVLSYLEVSSDPIILEVNSRQHRKLIMAKC